jgi:cobalt-zinc-cadmium efflux system outer membrane protein
VAEREAEIAALRLESERISVEAELIRRFAPVLSTQRKLALLDSLLEVSTRGTEAVQRLVDAGAAMEIDLVRAELERDELLLERAELVRTTREVKVRLGELWGDTAPGFDGVWGSLSGTLELPTLQELTTAMENHPEARLLELEGLLIEAEIREARAEGAPELALSGGYLRNNELDEEAVIAGVSLSLPIFNRNKGAVAQKRREMAAVGHEAEGLRLERASGLATLYSEIVGTRGELRALSGNLLPKASHIHDALAEFYLHGKTGILDVLEARGHLLELRMRIVDLLEEHAVLAADLHDLTGYRLDIFE